MAWRTVLLHLSLAGSLIFTGAPILDRRIVDTVLAGDAESEAMHGYAGYNDLAGVANDTTFRQAHGWMRYAMTAFDDTEVTVECTFAGDTATRHFDLVVEDSVVARRTVPGSPAAPSTMEIRVPFAVTKGRVNIAVMLRGREGPTPALRRLRIIQDHHEFAVSVPSLFPFGVVR